MDWNERPCHVFGEKHGVGTIRFRLTGRVFEVEVVVEGRTYSASRQDYWECLTSIRRLLEAENLLLCCAGARIDVSPSGMTRQAGGRKAYIHPPDRRPDESDLIDVFDPVDAGLVATVDEQLANVRAIQKHVLQLLLGRANNGRSVEDTV